MHSVTYRIKFFSEEHSFTICFVNIREALLFLREQEARIEDYELV